MTVSSRQIINKMIEELQRAKTVDSDISKVRIHLQKVQVLSELLLDETIADSFSDDVQRQMTGRSHVETDPVRIVQADSNMVEEQEDSIFDF